MAVVTAATATAAERNQNFGKFLTFFWNKIDFRFMLQFFRSDSFLKNGPTLQFLFFCINTVSCAYHLTAPGSSPKHTIFVLYLSWEKK